MDENLEIVVDPNGQARQAGADMAEGEYVRGFKERAEKSLYVFVRGVLGRTYLYKGLHLPICHWLVKSPPYRKMLLLPREHCKTTLISHGLPIHALIQPRENNIYIANRAGTDTRILLAGETEQRACNNLTVVEAAFETNTLLRALWPQACWEAPRKQAKKWNSKEMICPRSIDYPDPSVHAVGVGVAITGARFDIIVKDDLISTDAANSAVVMQTVKEWHTTSRALLESVNSLEFILGTRWANDDLYQEIELNDPTVAIIKHSVVEDGEVIYPSKFSLEKAPGRISIAELQKDYGVFFWLFYMNTSYNPEMTDFDVEDLRTFSVYGDKLTFDEDQRDLSPITKQDEENLTQELSDAKKSIRGIPLTPDTYDLLFERNQYIRAKYT